MRGLRAGCSSHGALALNTQGMTAALSVRSLYARQLQVERSPEATEPGRRLPHAPLRHRGPEMEREAARAHTHTHTHTASSYRRPDAGFLIAQREEHTAAITVIFAQRTQPVPDFRSWRWPSEHGMWRSSLRASLRPVSQLGVAFLMHLPQQQPGSV